MSTIIDFLYCVIGLTVIYTFVIVFFLTVVVICKIELLVNNMNGFMRKLKKKKKELIN